ncbi:MAG: hypothetical protein WEB50_15600 [Vicinamibacterales bacterium]
MTAKYRLRRLVQVVVLVALSLYAASAVDAARESCAEWYFWTQDTAQDICDGYGGQLYQEGDCWCAEDEFGNVEDAECNYLCLY